MFRNPWLMISALIVPWLMARVFPVGLVSFPGPLMVELYEVNPVVAVLKSVPKFAVIVLNESRPEPAIAPLLWFRVPLLMVQVRPEPMLMVPVLVKLGVVPLWLST